MGRGTSKGGGGSGKNAQNSDRKAFTSALGGRDAELQGSAKQISWAQDIRSGAKSTLKSMYDTAFEATQKQYDSFDERRKAAQQRFKETGDQSILRIANSYPTGNKQWQAAKKAAKLRGYDIDSITSVASEVSSYFSKQSSASQIISNRDDFSKTGLRERVNKKMTGRG